MVRHSRRLDLLTNQSQSPALGAAAANKDATRGCSLLDFRKDVFSQYGEDGIIAEIIRLIGAENRFFVEFGAGDGLYLSNTRALAQQGWSGVWIEADSDKFQGMQENAKGFSIRCVHRRIGICENTIDGVLDEVGAPENPDLCIIDIDGDDWQVWESMVRSRPRCVVVEANPTFPLNVEFVQKEGSYIGNSALALALLGKAKGYALVCYNGLNCFFVREDLASRLHLADRRFAALYLLDAVADLYAASSYDGKIFVVGNAVYGFREVAQTSDLAREAFKLNVYYGEWLLEF
ncbi:MAG: hypothetical protein A2Y78_08865 [Acidobacteria bacterium RBG_13_68_16]|nr:MAG: hypothetical protein A2Y78_08865 [Acidobacteria bacterium RBG_13_68_16]